LDELSEEERRTIKVVSMDMWEPYRQAVRHKLPWASIVADRFHVIKQLNHQLDLLRRNLRKNGDETLAELLKNSRWIWLKNRCDLTPEEKAKLQRILEASEELVLSICSRKNSAPYARRSKTKPGPNVSCGLGCGEPKRVVIGT